MTKIQFPKWSLWKKTVQTTSGGTIFSPVGDIQGSDEKQVKSLSLVQSAMINKVVQISANLQESPLQSSHCIYWRKIIFNAAQSRNLAASKDDPADHPA